MALEAVLVLSVFDLRNHARQVFVREGGLDLVVVDYLQLMRADPPANNRTADVSAFSRGVPSQSLGKP
jgi:replicative DNA helicase